VLPGTVNEVVRGLKEAGVTFCAHVPDSWMAPVTASLATDPDIQLVPVVNEGEGVAMCAGVGLAGRGAAMIMENSGVRMACEELARLGLGQGVPVLMLLPYRGDLGDVPFWAQPHGWTMEPILDALRVRYRIVRRTDEIRDVLRRAVISTGSSRNHVAVVFGAELCHPVRRADDGEA
jgi:sulfopyruvate decarboxylase subunit alpha